MNNAETINKFKKHINPESELVIGEDIFVFPPLLYEDLPDFYKFATLWIESADEVHMPKEELDKLSDKKKLEIIQKQAKKLYEMLSPDNVKLITGLCLKTMKLAYPDMDNNILKSFVANNFITMIAKLIEVNMPQDEIKR